jgi:hypothetical protein
LERKIPKRIGYDLIFVDKCGNEFDQFFMDVSPKELCRTGHQNAGGSILIYRIHVFISAKKEMKLWIRILRIEEQYNQTARNYSRLLADINEQRHIFGQTNEIFSQNKVDFQFVLCKQRYFEMSLKNGYFEAKVARQIRCCYLMRTVHKEAFKIWSWYFTFEIQMRYMVTSYE